MSAPIDLRKHRKQLSPYSVPALPVMCLSVVVRAERNYIPLMVNAFLGQRDNVVCLQVDSAARHAKPPLAARPLCTPPNPRQCLEGALVAARCVSGRTRTAPKSHAKYHRLDTIGISLKRSVFLLGVAGACTGNELSDAMGRPLVHPDKVYEVPQRAHHIHSAAHPPACPKYRPVPPSVRALGFRMPAAGSSDSCMLV
jgi:hypothetical protein